MGLWYLRAVELEDGRWTCRFGNEDLGVRPTREAALFLLAAVATELGGRDNFTFFLHYLNGCLESLDGSDHLPGENGGDAERGA